MTAYTDRLEKARIKSIPIFNSVSECGNGMGAHIKRAMDNAIIGVALNIRGEARTGWIGSLMNNFTPSAIGCRRPNGPTTLGPLRSCMYPRILRSRRVRKATANKIGIINSNG